MVWKNEFDHPESNSPSIDPVSVGFNSFCWFSGSTIELKFSEVIDGSGVSCGTFQ